MESKKFKNIKLGLVEGRHDLPVANCIFQEGDITFPLDMKELAQIADKRLSELGAVTYTSLDLYVTGLTAATLAVMRVAFVRGYLVTFHHFDRNSGMWLAQDVINANDINRDSDVPSWSIGAMP